VKSIAKVAPNTEKTAK